MIDPRHWHPAVRWLAIRIAALPVIFLVVSFSSFALIHGPWSIDLVESSFSEVNEDRLRRLLGLEDPWIERYFQWLGNAAQGDLGRSLYTDQPFRDMLADRWDATFELVLLSLAFLSIVAVPLAYLSVHRPRSLLDVTARALASLGEALPVFFIGTLVLLVPHEIWGYGPPQLGTTLSFFDDPWDNLRQFAPPAAIVAVTCLGVSVRAARAELAGTERIDAIVALRVTMAALLAALPLILAALVIVELVFGIKGLGILFFQSVFLRDFRATHLLLTLFVFVALVAQLLSPSAKGVAPMPRTFEVARLTRSPALVLSCLLLLAFAVLAALGEHAAPHNPTEIGLGPVKENPSWAHPFGTDDLGRDMFSRVVSGARPSFVFGLSVLALGFVPGLVVGTALARTFSWLARWTHEWSRIAPGAPAVLVVLSSIRFGDGEPIRWAIGVTAFFAAFAGVRTATSLVGATGLTLQQHVAQVGLPVIVSALRVFAAAVLLHGMIAWLGLDPFLVPTPTWGTDVSLARSNFPLHYPWLVFPGVALSLLLFTLSVLAESLSPATYDDSASAGEPAVGTTPSPAF